MFSNFQLSIVQLQQKALSEKSHKLFCHYSKCSKFFFNNKYEKKKHIWKRASHFFVAKPRCQDFKPMLEKADPKPMIGSSHNPIFLIRNIGSQPLKFIEPLDFQLPKYYRGNWILGVQIYGTYYTELRRVTSSNCIQHSIHCSL